MSGQAPGMEPWIGGVALSTAVMAVMAAVTTLYVGKFSSRAVMLQGQESNQWAYYQAKSIKSHAYEIQKEQMELSLLASRGALARPVAMRYAEVLVTYAGTIARYDREKEEIRSRAEAMAKERRISQARAGNFGYGLIFLQIAIMLSSIAALTKRKILWYLGMACSLGWVAFFVNAIVPAF